MVILLVGTKIGTVENYFTRCNDKAHTASEFFPPPAVMASPYNHVFGKSTQFLLTAPSAPAPTMVFTHQPIITIPVDVKAPTPNVYW
jgi:hypothetical protein